MSRTSKCHAKRALFVENNTEEIFEAGSTREQGTDITLMWRFLLQLPDKNSALGVRPSLCFVHCSLPGLLAADKVNDCLIYNQLFCPSSDSSYPCFSVGSSMKS